MKSLFICLLAIAAVCLVGACDSHPFSETKKLHEPYQQHGDHGGEHHEEAGAAHEAAPAHGEKK